MLTSNVSGTRLSPIDWKFDNDMPFPPSQREIYKINPLNEVICQLRFPPILIVSTETPAQFQDAVRSKYSEYDRSGNPGGLPFEIPPEIAQAFEAMPLLAPTGSVEHHFSTEDGYRSISLAQDFVAVAERRYDRWEHFRADLAFVEKVFSKTYSPAPYNRVGLRYVDVLIRSRFGMSETPWLEFLNPAFIGMLGDKEVAEHIQEMVVNAVLTIPDVDQGFVAVKHGLIRTQDENEQAYLIDADFHTTRRSDAKAAFEALDKFNRWGGDLFRWATTEQLRDSLGRGPLENSCRES